MNWRRRRRLARVLGAYPRPATLARRMRLNRRRCSGTRGLTRGRSAANAVSPLQRQVRQNPGKTGAGYVKRRRGSPSDDSEGVVPCSGDPGYLRGWVSRPRRHEVGPTRPLRARVCAGMSVTVGGKGTSATRAPGTRAETTGCCLTRGRSAANAVSPLQRQVRRCTLTPLTNTLLRHIPARARPRPWQRRVRRRELHCSA